MAAKMLRLCQEELAQDQTVLHATSTSNEGTYLAISNYCSFSQHKIIFLRIVSARHFL